MILSNFKTFTKKVCNGNEQTAYRYLNEIERGAMANGEYGRESFDYIPKTGRYFNAYTDEYYVFDLVKPAKWELVDENGEKVGEIDNIIEFDRSQDLSGEWIDTELKYLQALVK